MVLREDEKRALLEPLGLLSLQNLLKDRQGIGVPALHERVQGQKLEFLVLFCLRLDGSPALAANLDLQRAAVLDPVTLGLALAKTGTSFKCIGRTALFIPDVRLPVERCIRSATAQAVHLIE